MADTVLWFEGIRTSGPGNSNVRLPTRNRRTPGIMTSHSSFWRQMENAGGVGIKETDIGDPCSLKAIPTNTKHALDSYNENKPR
jgi:hypothetical protein